MTAWIDPLDVAFMEAVAWSEQMLTDLDAGWEPPCNAAALRRVRHDAMHAMAREIPDPTAYAADLTPEIAAALMEAVHGRNGGLWAPDGPLVPILRSMGLIAIRDRQLTSFAMEVRWALRIAAGETPPPRKVARTSKRASRPYTASEVESVTGGRDKASENPVRRVESSEPCHLCGCRPDTCTCRSARR